MVMGPPQQQGYYGQQQNQQQGFVDGWYLHQPVISPNWILQRKKECFTQQVWETNREVIAINIQELAP
jgi:hypothetical protein